MKITLDSMLTPEQAAPWLQMTKADLLAKCAARAIPAFRIGRKTLRINPRMTLAKLAADEGVKPEVIGAALNMKGTVCR